MEKDIFIVTKTNKGFDVKWESGDISPNDEVEFTIKRHNDKKYMKFGYIIIDSALTAMRDGLIPISSKAKVTITYEPIEE
jgi:hypothetical protein